MNFDPALWPRETALTQHIATLCSNSLRAYREDTILIQEHSNLERSVAQGSYGRRQVYELIQNGADALLLQKPGRIQVVLTESNLYCANEGDPIDREGAEALLHSNLSVKRGAEIGRFGLGFKSVLGVTQQPQFFCRSGSFGFDAAKAAEEVRRILPSAPHCPVLRLAYPIDAAKAAEEDPILRDLMSWATTVVRLDRDPSGSPWLEADIKNFPAEFLLFCEHVATVVLEDRAGGVRRELGIERTGDEYVLADGQNRRAWRKFQTSHRPSREARSEAGELADREKLPLIWAVPTQSRQIGHFWAFFPLGDETTLSGIVNAPWKTNDDRTRLAEGRFNEELLGAVCNLVMDSLPGLMKSADPGWVLDVMPARGREARCWADQLLTDMTYERASRCPSLPDQYGTLLCPSEMALHPPHIPRSVLDLWAAQPGRPAAWCHPTVENRERRSRAERLIEAVEGSVSTIPEWLHALIVDPSRPTSYPPSIRVAAALHQSIGEDKDHAESIREEIRKSWILLDDRGNRAQPIPDKIFLPADHRIESDTIRAVHPAIAEDKSIVDAIAALGIAPVTAELELDAVLRLGFVEWAANDWERFWALVRRVAPDSAKAIINKHSTVEGGRTHQVHIRTLAGEFQPLRRVLLPGPIVPQDGSRDSHVAVDQRFHSAEMDVLQGIGAVSSPVVGKGVPFGEVFLAYKLDCIARYYDALPKESPKPDRSYMVFGDAPFAGPLEPLMTLSDEGKALFAEALLQTEGGYEAWLLHHLTSQHYRPQNFEPPALWAIKRHGRLPTSLGPRLHTEAVGPKLDSWAALLPVAKCSTAAAGHLGLPASPDELASSHWTEATERMLRNPNGELMGRFYPLAAAHMAEVPARISCRVGNIYDARRPEEITVVSLASEFRALVKIGTPVIQTFTEADEKRLVDRWGCHPSEYTVRTQILHVPEGEPVSIVDQFRALRFRLDIELHQVQLVPCQEIRKETLTEHGKTSEPHKFWSTGKDIYWLVQSAMSELLEFINETLALRLSAEEQEEILQQRADQARRERLLEIRTRPTDVTRLLAAIGEDAIRPRLPAGLVQAVETARGKLNGELLAQLALIVYGVDVLREFKQELEQKGLEPPQRWAGSLLARKFVSELGFGRPFAGFEEARRDPVISVDGPCRLPPLHAFQDLIKSEIRVLLRAPEGSRRGLLSLPTGAGKTRVAVQGIVEAFCDHEIGSPVLWIAQSDELCEQAVQTWREVWRAEGAGEPLQISRLWAQNDAEEADAAPHVVVATIQKLSNCIKNESYEWLSKASIVVIDEAHVAIGQTYTELLKWTGIDRKEERCPLLGLTATPFRGRSATETERLVARFGRRRLDLSMGDDPYHHLQELGVLSKVEHDSFEGIQVSLSESELAELNEKTRVPSSVYDRIAADANRNQRLIAHIAAKYRLGPVLVFAASVEHAQTIAALLSLKDIRAAPISANTDPGARREYIRDFRQGKLDVLTNYNVLTQGFDAPATRAIYVARPTFSPNQYQQMIGRGLRGPMNGGKETCLIVNVQDNFAQYGKRLAFCEFEHLWRHGDVL